MTTPPPRRRGVGGGVLTRLHDAPVLLLCLAVLGWSGNFVVGRLVGGSVPPTSLAFARWVIAAALLAPVGWRRLRADLPALAARPAEVITLSITGVAIFNAFVYRGLGTTSAVNGLLLQSACPVLIVVVAFVLFRERPSLAGLAGLAVSLVGVWIVISHGRLLDGGLTFGAGDLWILAAVASYAVYTCLLRVKPAVHPVSLLLSTFALGALALVPFAAAEWVAGDRIPATPGAAAAIAYVAVVPSIVSFFCWNRGVELLGAARAGQFIHLMPVFGAVLAFVVLGERLEGYHLLGAAIIGAGIVLASRTPTGRSTQTNPTPN